MPSILKSAEAPEQIIDRCNLLANRFLDVQYPNSRTAILFCSGVSISHEFTNAADSSLAIYSFGNGRSGSLRFLAKSYRILRQLRDGKITLVAGDNYKALLVSLILKTLLRSETTIQITFHGNPLVQESSLFRTLARKAAFKFLVPKAMSVRYVSEHLREELGPYTSSHAQWFVSPIPIRYPSEFGAKSEDSYLGLIGRLHPERGIDLFCLILERLSELELDYKFLVIGDGPEKAKIENFISLHPNYPVRLLGTLPKSEVIEKFRNISILLSCAPNEGYGLAMREAILSGTFVVARSNAGTRELKSQFPEMVFLFDSVEGAIREIQSHLAQNDNLEVVKRYRQKQSEFDESSVQALINSWL